MNDTLTEYTFISYEGIYTKVIFHSFLSKPRKVQTLKIQNERDDEMSLQRRIKEPNKVKTFHEKYTLIIQLIL